MERVHSITTVRHPLAVAALALLSGCATMNNAERGALVGTTIGALSGAIIGHESGNTGAGTVIGAGAGMMAGTLIGDAEDARLERDWALSQVQQSSYQTSGDPPLTNADLIYMAQNGLGDEVILNAVDARGGRFQLDPTSLVQLKHSGVSDHVLAQIQRTGGPATVKVVRPRSPRVVYVEPTCPPPRRTTWSVQLGTPGYHHQHCHHW